MSNPERTEQEARRLEQASEWLIRLQEDDVADEEIVRWIDWCEAHADNRKAFQDLLPLWQAFDDRNPSLHLSALEERLAMKLTGEGLSSASSADPARNPLITFPLLKRGKGEGLLPLPRSSPKVLLAIAASLILALAALFTFRPDKKDFVPTLAPVATLESEPGHIRPAVLPDGSKLDLGARSAIAINFTGQQRHIEMEDGEAFFTVKPDNQKPFIVDAGKVRVTAVGTQFNVQKTGDRVVVTVSEGTVRVDSSPPSVEKTGVSGSSSQPLMAPAGYQVIYDTALSTKPTMRAIDPAASTAWRQGRLEYISEPLSSVIATLNRYSEQSIVLEDPTLSRLNYTGTIEVESVGEWVEALPRIFPVKVQRVSADQLRIARQP